LGYTIGTIILIGLLCCGAGYLAVVAFKPFSKSEEELKKEVEAESARIAAQKEADAKAAAAKAAEPVVVKKD